ncbi:cryptochrome/photolyase family protein [Autumnicola psychrophila]|uniref:Cryptochrome/photolyase family protein n=1 Tax=Autumnicola psychrophila TaxID=3075592 RepID=A0ABU3DSD3_9FLAO|nr:cryptochrome/photolyase family protein [Zunongwangia sp. F225]MDT0686616.1 cryptochrome/photolyase family protein [Zunongwangia sp. F225]
MSTAKLIFPNQLFKSNPLFSIEGDFYLIEENLFFKQFKFHKQKIAFHRATIKFYQDFLLEKDFSVKYFESQQQEADIRQLIVHLNGWS